MPISLDVENISFSYGSSKILNNTALSVGAGESIIITGKSGSGKSTFLEICAGLIEPHTGNVLWNGKNLNEYTYFDMVELRRKTGFVFQVHALIANFTVFENIALPLRYHTNYSNDKIKNLVDTHIQKYGLEDIAYKRPEQLSIGQTREASIARALVANPEILFLDEPTSGLDPITAETIIDTLKSLQKDNNLTIIMISHIVNVIEQMNSRVMRMENGILAES